MKLTIIHTNDIHSQLACISKISGYINNQKEINNNCIAIDCGDIMTGSIHNLLFNGEIEGALIKNVDYDLLAIGNHEFDLDQSALTRYMETTKKQFINANIKFNDQFDDIPISSTIIKQIEDVKIGFVSVTTFALETRLKDFDMTIEMPLIALERYVKQLREDGCDIVVAMNHIGYNEDLKALETISGIDLIVSAHSHTVISEIDDINVVQTGSYAQNIGHIELEIENKQIINIDYKLIDIASIDKIDQSIEEVFEHYDKIVSKVGDEVIANTSTRLIGNREEISEKHTNLGALVCDSFMHVAEKNNIQCDFAILNARGIRVDINPGDIKVKDIYQVVPFDRNIKVVSIKGKDLISAITTGNFVQCSNLYIEYDECKSRLFYQKNNQLIEVDEKLNYKLATNEYVLTGSSFYHDIVNHQVIENLGKDVDVVIEYVRSLEKNFDYQYENTILKER